MLKLFLFLYSYIQFINAKPSMSNSHSENAINKCCINHKDKPTFPLEVSNYDCSTLTQYGNYRCNSVYGGNVCKWDTDYSCNSKKCNISKYELQFDDYIDIDLCSGGQKNDIMFFINNISYLGTISISTNTIDEMSNPIEYGYNEDEQETTPQIIEPESNGSEEIIESEFVYLGDGGCRAGFQNSKSLTTYKHANVNGFDECVKNCVEIFAVKQFTGDPGELDSYFVNSIGLEFRPNIPFIPNGNWRNTKYKQNCVCLKKIKTRRGKEIIEITGTTGSRKKDGPTKESYTQCFKRIPKETFYG